MFKNFFSQNYWFDATPGIDFSFAWAHLAISLLLLGLSFFTDKKIPRNNFWSGAPSRLRELTFLALVWGFFRWQNVPFLSMRIWMLLLFTTGALYLAWMAKSWKREKSKDTTKKKMKTDPYLPKPKKKRR